MFPSVLITIHLLSSISSSYSKYIQLTIRTLENFLHHESLSAVIEIWWLTTRDERGFLISFFNHEDELSNLWDFSLLVASHKCSHHSSSLYIYSYLSVGRTWSSPILGCGIFVLQNSRLANHKMPANHLPLSVCGRWYPLCCHPLEGGQQHSGCCRTGSNWGRKWNDNENKAEFICN